MYATAIRLDPGLTQAYKDYGLMLNDHGGDPKQIIALWQHYLRAGSARSAGARDQDGPQASERSAEVTWLS